MNAETKICQHCKTSFVIEPEDFEFYDKIKVPPPTFCPRCRLQRRLAWFKAFRLYKRKCDLCGEEKISMYRPDAPYVVYCPECWLSDKWNAADYGVDYDFSKPFFEQFNKQMHRVPLRGLAISKDATEFTPFTNHCSNSKNSYLIFYSDYDEDCLYGFYLARSKSLLDCSGIWESEGCYDSMNGFRNSRVHGSRGDNHNSIDCFFVRDAINAEHCFGSANLHNKKYVLFNEQLSKEEYEKKVNEIDLGSYKTYQEMKTKSEEVWKSSIPYPYHINYSENSTGNHIIYCKNCKECYDSGYCENCKYTLLIKNPSVKDSYDYTDWGEGAERLYECITAGNAIRDVKFSQDLHASHDVEYSKSCFASAYLFGCIGIKSGDYYILNKKYGKKEFFEMRGKIISHMAEIPYKDEIGRIYGYGEFFPTKLAPHDYNDTFANFFFPIKKEMASQEGLTWMETPQIEYKTTINSDDLPDHIKEATDDVLNKSIKCETCSRGYRIIPQELQFLKHYNFPLPRRCPFCRLEEKVRRWIWQLTLVDRNCDRCGAAFRTNYMKEDAPVVYCKKCYYEEIFI
jgi:hypothetical protein